jgi:hypothetical protein
VCCCSNLCSSGHTANVVLVVVVIVVVVVVVDIGDGVADGVEGEHDEGEKVVRVEAVAAVAIWVKRSRT